MPVSLRLLCLETIYKRSPIKARIGVKDDGFKSVTKTFLPSIPARLRIQAVTVVPMLAPMMTFMDCCSVIRPEFTKPTTMTVVAEELWIMAVTTRPVRTPANFPEVSRLKMLLSLLPARRSRACPISDMPNKNRHRPPIRLRTLNKLMFLSPFVF